MTGTAGEHRATPWDTTASAPGPWHVGAGHETGGAETGGAETGGSESSGAETGGAGAGGVDRWEERGSGTGRARPDTWRLNTDPDAVRRDLSRLVLTLVELLRQLVERQAIRRMDQGDLSDEQVETLGLTLMRLEEAMTELCERFDLSPSDLNLDLGPLGTLLPTDSP